MSDHFTNQWSSEFLGAMNAKKRGDKKAKKNHQDRADMWARIGDSSDASRRAGKGGKHRGEH